MVGLVVVSHSAQAAAGIRAVAQEMGGDARIEAVGGTPDGGIGTTPEPIRDAIDAVAADAGDVVVLADLGSAVMNAELAIEGLDDGSAVAATVELADAPILEGTLNAAVAATAPDATLASVREAAEQARDLSKL